MHVYMAIGIERLVSIHGGIYSFHVSYFNAEEGCSRVLFMCLGHYFSKNFVSQFHLSFGLYSLAAMNEGLLLFGGGKISCNCGDIVSYFLQLVVVSHSQFMGSQQS